MTNFLETARKVNEAKARLERLMEGRNEDSVSILNVVFVL